MMKTNFFNFRRYKDRYLLTNDFGRYAFVSKEELNGLIYGNLDENTDIYTELEEKGFIYSTSDNSFINEFRDELRYSKSYLFSCTSLHIFVLTNACNLQCIYCQARTGKEDCFGFMDKRTAESAVLFALSAPDNYLVFEFQGGEPLINFDVLKHIVEFTEKNKKDKHIEYTVVSNLLLADEEIISFIKKYKISVSTSFDGNRAVHNYNRPYINGRPTYDDVKNKIDLFRKHGIWPGAIETTTRYSLSNAREIVNAYLEEGFNAIFLRPLTPLGYAIGNWEKIGYSAEEFIEFYRTGFKYIVDLNRDGISIVEKHAEIFLRRILKGEGQNYMELRSPCGAAIGQLAYFFDGRIFTCDEGRMLGEMGDDSFALGNVFDHSYDEVICSGKCKAVMSSSLLESLPQCSDCVYQPYCGTCPVLNLSMKGNIFKTAPNDYKCKINKGILDVIFEYFYNKDEGAISIFYSWVEDSE